MESCSCKKWNSCSLITSLILGAVICTFVASGCYWQSREICSVCKVVAAVLWSFVRCLCDYSVIYYHSLWWRMGWSVCYASWSKVRESMKQLYYCTSAKCSCAVRDTAATFDQHLAIFTVSFKYTTHHELSVHQPNNFSMYYICLLILVSIPSSTALLWDGIPFLSPLKIVCPYIVSSAT